MFFGKVKNVLSRAKAGIHTAVSHAGKLAGQVGHAFGVAKETYKAIAPHLSSVIGEEAAGKVDSLANRAIDKAEEIRGKAMDVKSMGEEKLKDLAGRGAKVLAALPNEVSGKVKELGI